MAVPKRIMTNHDLGAMVDTSDEWIRARTGIRARHVVSEGETTATLGTEAAQQALRRADLDPAQLDLIICATTTPDHLMPATACLIQHALGARRAAGFDLEAACTGFVYALAVGAQFIASGVYRRILVIGSDTLTRYLDWTDRRTCILFGDGAGALVLEASDTPAGLLGIELGADGSGANLLSIPAGGSRQPITEAVLASGAQYIQMVGSEVYKFGVRVMGEATVAAVEHAGLSLDDIDLFVPHQANIRIIESAAARLGIAPERVVVNLDRYGNTSAGSIPIALCEAAEDGRLQAGSRVLIVGMGAGLTWGAAVLQWTCTTTASNGHYALPARQATLVYE